MEAVDTPDRVDESRPPLASRLQGWRLGLLLLAIVAVLHVPAFVQPVFDNDETYIATVASVMGDGGELYEDAVDRKPPLVFLAYEAAFEVTGTTDLWGPRMLGVLCLALNAGLVAMLARRRFGDRAALLAGVLAALTTATLLPRDAQSANFEVFMLPGITGAMVLADRRRPLGAGLALGVATLAKQVALPTLVPLGWLAWREGPPRRWRSLVLLLVGTIAPLGVAAIAFGARDFVFWNFTGNEGYLDVGGAWGLVLGRMVRMTLWFALLNVVLVAALPFAWRNVRRDLDLWLWLGSAAIAIVAGWRFWGHYYWQALPPLCVLAAEPLSRAGRRLAVAAVAVTGAIALGVTGFALVIDRVQPWEHWRPLAAYVDEHTEPDDRIFVWGHVPEVYWASDRRPATRLVTTGFLTGHTGGRPKDRVGEQYAVAGIWDDFMADLEAHPPAMILDTTDANLRSSRTYPPSDYPRFDAWLREHYVEVDRVDDVAIWVPKG